MIENTLMSLVSLMAIVWMATQGLKRALPKVPQDLIAIVLGQACTVVFWKMGVIKLEGLDPLFTTPWSYAMVSIYGLLAYGVAAKSHDIGQNPKKLLKRTRDGKVIE